MKMSLAELRRSYWWACRYIESLYRDFGDWSVVSEYQTKTPFMQYVWVYPYNMIHPMGGGMMIGFAECDPTQPLVWQPFSWFHNVWSYVHNATRDYNVIGRIGFEDTEPEWYVCSLTGDLCKNPVGDPFPYYNSDCNDPTIFVEYTRNRLKNGTFTFRQYLDPDISYDPAAYWSITATEGNTSISYIDAGKSYIGSRSLLAEIQEVALPPSGKITISQTCNVLPDTEYVLSFYYWGRFVNEVGEGFQPEFIAIVRFLDVNGNIVGSETGIPPDSEDLQPAWKDYEVRFRTSSETASVEVLFILMTVSREFAVLGLDMVWLSECPINLNPYYVLFAQLERYVGDRESDIYFEGEKIWDGVTASNVPRNVFETQISLDGIPSFRSAIRHSVQDGVFYYKHSSMCPDWNSRSGKLQNFRDLYGYTYDYYHPLWRETIGYPDTYMFTHEAVRDCEAWFDEMYPPTGCAGGSFYPYWSKVCMCRDVAIVGLATKNPYFPSLIAIHLMNKYNDPFKKAEVGYYGGPDIGFIPVSAYDLLFIGIPTLIPAVKDWIDPDKGWHRGDGVYSVYAAACALVAFAEIGYGFQNVMEQEGYTTQAATARDYADRLAVTLLKVQWGYPFEAGKPGYFKHEDFEVINNPESAGGFLVLTIYKNGEVYATSRKDWLTKFTDLFNMPSETPGVIPVNQETTFICMRALQIYEWYKYKGGKGVFPKLLLPADIDGDGYVSDLDVAKVQFCIDNNIYNMLCDINADGVIDSKDLDLVKANLGRGTPIKGVVWAPTISDTVQVEVT